MIQNSFAQCDAPFSAAMHPRVPGLLPQVCLMLRIITPVAAENRRGGHKQDNSPGQSDPDGWPEIGRERRTETACNHPGSGRGADAKPERGKRRTASERQTEIVGD